MEYSEAIEEPHQVYLNFTALGKILQLKVNLFFYDASYVTLAFVQISNSTKFSHSQIGQKYIHLLKS